jgi:hypothetical protein
VTAGASCGYVVTSAPPPPDTDPPLVAISCPARVAMGVAATAHWTAADAGSGLATPAAGDVALDTKTAGTKTVAAPDARDVAGNVKTGVSCSYTVVAAKITILTRNTKVRPSAKGDVSVKLKCTGVSCKGKLTLKATYKVGGQKRAIVFSAKSYTIAGGKTATVKWRLGKSKLALLKRVKKMTMTATSVLAPGTGSPTTTKATFTLIPPK